MCCHHPERDAVAICVNCRRALCPQCAFTVPDYRITCGECAHAVAASGSVDFSPNQKRRFLKGGIVSAFIGSAILIFGLLDRHYRWTDYSDVWSIASIAFFYGPVILALQFIGVKLEARYTARKKTHKGGRR